MRFKLDENLGQRGAKLLKQAGHDDESVVSQRITSSSDEKLITVCSDEGRCLITLDLDFANVFRFPPAEYRGICVLRLPRNPSSDHLLIAIQTLIAHLHANEIGGKLWIVELGRVREHEADDEQD